MPKNPLAEIFGYPVSNMTQDANNHRHGRLCPYHNSSGINCTKSSATDPIGVCTIFDGNKIVSTCPIRFRDDFRIVSDAADFFFASSNYVAVTEARLKDLHGKSAGNIDIVIATLNKNGEITDFGAVEVQAVYITGNVRNVFDKYMENPEKNQHMAWPARNYPALITCLPRERLAPQLIYKGGILHKWGKKMAVVVDENFFAQLPTLKEVDKESADIAWMVYDFQKKGGRYSLRKKTIRYTQFESALATITTPEVGNPNSFVEYLKDRIARGKIMGMPTSSGISPDVEPLPNSLSE